VWIRYDLILHKNICSLIFDIFKYLNVLHNKLIVMIYKYFRKMNCLGADHKKMIMISPIIHSFSVVNHQTFGQFLTKADPVMIQLQSLNKYFAQK